jgi:ribosomal protein S18 acetylase RimI-like enzyme
MATSDGAGALSYSLRSFRMEDYDAVLALWRNAGSGVSVRPSDRRAEVAKKLGRDPDLFWCRAGGPRGGVIMGAWDGRRGGLHHLAVDVAYRQAGIGSALIAEVEARLRAKGCLKVNLLVWADNQAARRLYARLGYQEMEGLVAMGKEL